MQDRRTDVNLGYSTLSVPVQASSSPEWYKPPREAIQPWLSGYDTCHLGSTRRHIAPDWATSDDNYIAGLLLVPLTTWCVLSKHDVELDIRATAHTLNVGKLSS
jgi:hypothetical protein